MTAPLVVDLDGTLTPTDTLVESIIQLGKQHPLSLFKLPFWLFKGRANFKANIASRLTLPVVNLPYRSELIDYLRSEKQHGRCLILATAAHTSIANAVATHLDLFDTVLASDENRNLKGASKLAAIQQTVGSNFVYAGDSKADLPIWQAAQKAILVNVAASIGNEVRKSIPIEREFTALEPPPPTSLVSSLTSASMAKKPTVVRTITDRFFFSRHR
jgi:phosphoserine phosphatase